VTTDRSEIIDPEEVARDKAILDVGIKGIEDKPIHISLFAAGFLLGIVRQGKFTTTQGKYQAAVAQGELEQALLPFLPKETKEPTRAERRRRER
jgi:hypothetical protein